MRCGRFGDGVLVSDVVRLARRVVNGFVVDIDGVDRCGAVRNSGWMISDYCAWDIPSKCKRGLVLKCVYLEG